MFAHVELFINCSAMDKRLDAFKTLTGISSFFSVKQKYLHCLGHALFLRSLVFNPI